MKIEKDWRWDLDLYLCGASSSIFYDKYTKFMVWLPNYKSCSLDNLVLIQRLRSMFPGFQARFVKKVLIEAGYEGIYGLILSDYNWPKEGAEKFGLFQVFTGKKVFCLDAVRVGVEKLTKLAQDHPDKQIGLVLFSVKTYNRILCRELKGLPDNVLVWGVKCRN